MNKVFLLKPYKYIALNNTSDRWGKDFLRFNDRSISPTAPFFEFKYSSRFLYIARIGNQFDFGLNLHGFKTIQIRL